MYNGFHRSNSLGSRQLIHEGLEDKMAGSLNKVMLIGNLGADPEVRRLQDGRAVCNLRIATSDTWRDKATGERRERTEWHKVVIFNENLVKVAESYLRKGSKVFLEGALQTRKYTDKDNIERYSTEIVLQQYNGQLTMLDGRSGSGSSDAASSGEDFGSSSPMRSSSGGSRAEQSFQRGELDDEVPF